MGDMKGCIDCNRDDEKEMEVAIGLLQDIAEENKFITIWSCDEKELPIRDFSKKHGFKCKKVKRVCYCVRDLKPQVMEIEGDTMLDVWKAFDKLLRKFECGHIFIESLTEKDGFLEIDCGS